MAGACGLALLPVGPTVHARAGSNGGGAGKLAADLGERGRAAVGLGQGLSTVCGAGAPAASPAHAALQYTARAHRRAEAVLRPPRESTALAIRHKVSRRGAREPGLDGHRTTAMAPHHHVLLRQSDRVHQGVSVLNSYRAYPRGVTRQYVHGPRPRQAVRTAVRSPASPGEIHHGLIIERPRCRAWPVGPEDRSPVHCSRNGVPILPGP
jgi:hypothetical protein